MGRGAMIAAAAIWVGALFGPMVQPGVAVAGLTGCALAAAVHRTRAVGLLAVAALGLISGAVAADRIEATLAAGVPQGPGVLSGVAASDVWPFGDQYRYVLRPHHWQPLDGDETDWLGPPIAVVTQSPRVVAGDHVRNEGLLRSIPDLVRGDPVAGRLVASNTEIIGSGDFVLLAAGNTVRRTVQTRLAILGDSAETALLAGFLIGDVADLPQSDYEALRRSGLTHFVAVSGSNVALVLGAWWLVVGPLGAGNRIRALTGFVVLAVFVVATRWESSVVRAAAMATLVLGSRAFGVPLDAWTALGGAVTILLAVSGNLAYDVGFQLSVVATAGVLVGMNWWTDRSPRLLWAALSATVAAQLAVMPLLLIHFGTIPLLAPVANVVAAPLVTASTALAGAGVVVGWDPLLVLAEYGAGAVLAVARIAGGWPQLDLVGVLLVAGAAVVARNPGLRPVIVGLSLCIAVVAVIPPGPPPVPTITFLDVGQGDAVLLQDPSGAIALVDGGRDPDVLATALRRYGVTRIDLLVATHGDADHVGGFQGLGLDVGRMWVPGNQSVSSLLAEIVANVAALEVPVDEVEAGDSARLGDFELQVLGPVRRYGAENDGSVVLWVVVGENSALLPGDIGAVAQRDLSLPKPDLLLVPHHGSATTDQKWLERTVGEMAVISVGPNNYGHPDPQIVATLEQAGVAPQLTMNEGDISVPFGGEG